MMRDGDGDGPDSPSSDAPGVVARASGDAARWVTTCRSALAEADPLLRAEAYLGYLERYPTGRENRRAAEAVESLLLRVPDDARDRVATRLREVRERVMPPLEPDSWKR